MPRLLARALPWLLVCLACGSENPVMVHTPFSPPSVSALTPSPGSRLTAGSRVTFDILLDYAVLATNPPLQASACAAVLDDSPGWGRSLMGPGDLPCAPFGNGSGRLHLRFETTPLPKGDVRLQLFYSVAGSRTPEVTFFQHIYQAE